MESDICIIGAGPAGMMAALGAGNDKKIVIIESNTTAGRKLLLTGRGRCNLTHTGTIDEFIREFKPFDRFVRHCIHEFSPVDLRKFFSHRGLETVEEPDGSVFPKTNRSGDVKQILVDEIKKPNIRILYGKKVQTIKFSPDPCLSDEALAKADGRGLFIVESEKFKISVKSVIIATGGVSWPQTGSTGDGYKFAQAFGHKIIEPKASVVPLVTAEKFCASLAGVGIQNVRISCNIDDKKISARGAMIFTHNGIGGPAVFDLSRFITDSLYENKKNPIMVSIDLLPEETSQQIDKELVETISENPKKNIASIIAQSPIGIPKALAEKICESGFRNVISGQLSKKDRKTLIENLKNFRLSITSTEPVEKATVTRGGVCFAQIDSKTMQSKLCPGLFFAGEVMDIDGPCGGYNLQFAFSSGFLAGKSAVESLK